MNLKFIKYLAHFKGAVELLLLNLSFFIAYAYKFETFDSFNIDQDPRYVIQWLSINVIGILLYVLFRLNRAIRTQSIKSILGKKYLVLFAHIMMVSMFIVVKKGYYYSREHLLVMYSVFTFAETVWTVVFVYGLRKFRAKGYNTKNVFIVGYGKVSQELETYFSNHPEHGYKVAGCFDNNGGSENVKPLSEIENAIAEKEISELYCCLTYVPYEEVQKLVEFCEENLIRMKLLTDFRGVLFKQLELEKYDHIPILKVNNSILDYKSARIIKRLFDFAFSAVVIVGVLSWLIPVLGIIIKLESKGPVFFMQNRTGKNNKTFNCFKFRSMAINEQADTLSAKEDITRITRVGRFIRKTSLDELPQFINVFLGDMSVVGPRPHMLKHTDDFRESVTNFNVRHAIKPGITGLAQAKGYRGDVDPQSIEGRVRFDRFYINNWSLTFDVKIILMTIGEVLSDYKKVQ